MASISNIFIAPRAQGMSPATTMYSLDGQPLSEDSGQVDTLVGTTDAVVFEVSGGDLSGANARAALTSARDALLGRVYSLAHQLTEGGPVLQNMFLANSVVLAASAGATAAIGMFPIAIGGITGGCKPPSSKDGENSKAPSLKKLVNGVAKDTERMVGDTAEAVGKLAGHAVDGAIDAGKIASVTILPASAVPGVIALGEAGGDALRRAEQVVGDVAVDGMKALNVGAKAYFDVATAAGSMYCPVGAVFAFGDFLARIIEFFYDPKLPKGHRSAFARLCSRLFNLP